MTFFPFSAKSISWFSVFPVPQNCLCSPVPLIVRHLFTCSPDINKPRHEKTCSCQSLHCLLWRLHFWTRYSCTYQCFPPEGGGRDNLGEFDKNPLGVPSFRHNFFEIFSLKHKRSRPCAKVVCQIPEDSDCFGSLIPRVSPPPHPPLGENIDYHLAKC